MLTKIVKPTVDSVVIGWMFCQNQPQVAFCLDNLRYYKNHCLQSINLIEYYAKFNHRLCFILLFWGINEIVLLIQ